MGSTAQLRVCKASSIQKILAPVRRQKGVGHTKLEEGELGARLQMNGFPRVILEGGVVSGDSLAAVHVDSGAHLSFTFPEAPPRRLVGGRAVAYLPGPLGAGPAGVHDAFGAGASNGRGDTHCRTPGRPPGACPPLGSGSSPFSITKRSSHRL